VRYGILGEDTSDAKTVAVLVRRLIETLPPKKGKKGRSNKNKPSFRTKGYGGWAHLCKKAARDIGFLRRDGCQRFVVCVDADGPSPDERRQMVNAIMRKSGISAPTTCAIVAVQEIEAWILADLEEAALKVILRWNPTSVPNPEGQPSPKEHIRRLSRHPETKKARYDEVIHNEKMAEYLRLEQLLQQCKSFRPLAAFVSSYDK
jgi:hypothetical protein